MAVKRFPVKGARRRGGSGKELGIETSLYTVKFMYGAVGASYDMCLCSYSTAGEKGATKSALSND